MTETTTSGSKVASAQTAPAAKPAQPVQHQEPQHGGSYTRNLDTGELVSNAPAKVDQPDQE